MRVEFIRAQFLRQEERGRLVTGISNCDVDHLTQCALAAACHTQLLVHNLRLANAELNISFHDGVASPPGLAVRHWLPADHGPAAVGQLEQAIYRFWPAAARQVWNADELRAGTVAGISELIRFCRFSLGDYQFGLDFGHVQLTIRDGVLHDFVFGRRFFLHEVPGLGDFALALQRAGKLPSRRH